MSNKKFTGNVNGKGYYIALILCAVAIGISGYLYYRNTQKPEQSLEGRPSASTQTPDSGTDVQAVATQPDSNATQSTAPATPTDPDPQTPLRGKMPVSGQTVAEYSMEALSYNQTTRDWRTHNGIDIAAQTGTAVTASADGTVYNIFEDETMGTTVVLRHRDGYVTTYASLSENLEVAVGDTVSAGDTLGYVGATALLETAIGEHVHFCVTCNDVPVDPSEFLES